MAFGRKKKQQEEQPQGNPFIGPDGRARIAVAGAGYVGLSMAALLARHNDVMLVDVVPESAQMVNARVSPVADPEIEAAFAAAAAGEEPLALGATTDPAAAYQTAAIAIICTPTVYDAELERFDPSSVEEAVAAVRAANPLCWIAIASIVPVGFTAELSERLDDARIVCCPSFVREGHGLFDARHPSRIVVGVDLNVPLTCEFGAFFARLLAEAADEPMDSIPQLVMSRGEAEAVKLFADTYLALRVSFFNELDSFASQRGLNTAPIIQGVGLDPRIDDRYDNPSFGYGGYLPAVDGDAQGAFWHLGQVIQRANGRRASLVADQAQALLREWGGFGTGVHPVVGVYRLTRTPASGSLIDSAVYAVMECLRDRGVDMIIYEPLCLGSEFGGVEVVETLDELKRRSTLILANRYNPELDDVREKVYTRDHFGRD